MSNPKVNKKKNIITNLDKKMLLGSLIYFLEPYYMDHRGKEKRKFVRDYLKINIFEEKELLSKLAKDKKIELVGNSYFVSDVLNVKLWVNQMIKKREMNLKIIINRFLNI